MCTAMSLHVPARRTLRSGPCGGRALVMSALLIDTEVEFCAMIVLNCSGPVIRV